MSAKQLEPMRRCRHCGNWLTLEEQHYYGQTCNICEAAYHARLKAWRRGADDPELDAMFSAPKPRNG